MGGVYFFSGLYNKFAGSIPKAQLTKFFEHVYGIKKGHTNQGLLLLSGKFKECTPEDYEECLNDAGYNREAYKLTSK